MGSEPTDQSSFPRGVSGVDIVAGGREAAAVMKNHPPIPNP